jgi:glycosyltransferase 2 family protein
MSRLIAKTPFWKTTWFRVTIGTLVSVFFLYLALRDVPLDAVVQALAQANYVWIALAILVKILQSWLKTTRWIQLFYPLQKGLSQWRMFGVILIADMLNIVTPWRLGDLARIYLAGEMENRSKAQTLATLGTEKVFDTTMMLALILGIPFFITLPTSLEKPREGFIVLSIVFFGGALVLMLVGDRLLVLMRRIPIPALERFLDTHGALALGSLGVLKRWDLHLGLQALSVVIYFMGVVINYLTLLALNLQLPLITSFLLLVVLLIGGFVPSAPGKVGVFQYLCIATLSLFAVDQTIGLAYGILLYVVAYGTPLILGVLFLWWGGISLKSIRAAQAASEV